MSENNLLPIAALGVAAFAIYAMTKAGGVTQAANDIIDDARRALGTGEGGLPAAAEEFGARLVGGDYGAQVARFDNIRAADQRRGNRLPDTRGVRNNNPGNIKYNAANNWQGQIGNDGTFARFDTPRNGLRAMAIVLRTYRDQYNLNTVWQYIDRYTATNDNPYFQWVLFRLGYLTAQNNRIDFSAPVPPASQWASTGVPAHLANTPLGVDLASEPFATRLMRAMCEYENGTLLIGAAYGSDLAAVTSEIFSATRTLPLATK